MQFHFWICIVCNNQHILICRWNIYKKRFSFKAHKSGFFITKTSLIPILHPITAPNHISTYETCAYHAYKFLSSRIEWLCSCWRFKGTICWEEGGEIEPQGHKGRCCTMGCHIGWCFDQNDSEPAPHPIVASSYKLQKTTLHQSEFTLTRLSLDVCLMQMVHI